MYLYLLLTTNSWCEEIYIYIIVISVIYKYKKIKVNILSSNLENKNNLVI